MSWQPSAEPECTEREADVVDLQIAGRARDLGGFTVRRVLPSPRRRLVGPFIFFDEMGPVRFEPERGLDVRPHPHIGLATVTYLFDGEIVHRDSLGTELAIRPGAVNWMTAGRGIVHSERVSAEARERQDTLHGIQAWVALPQSLEETEPAFVHHPAERLPRLERGGITLSLIAGEAYGERAPVEVASPLFYLHAEAPEGGRLEMPTEYEERAVYVVRGSVRVGGSSFVAGQMAVLRGGAAAHLDISAESRLMLLGGAPIDGERHIYWNFVSSSKERLERAKADWREDRFPKVPGDDERIPLPD